MLMRQNNSPVTKVGLSQWLQQNTTSIKRPQDGTSIIILRPELSNHFGLQDQLQQYDPTYLHQQRYATPQTQPTTTQRQYRPQYYSENNGAIDLTGEDDEMDEQRQYYTPPVKPIPTQPTYAYQHASPQKQQPQQSYVHSRGSNEQLLDEEIKQREPKHDDSKKPNSKRDRHILPLSDALVGDALEIWSFCFMFRKPLLIYPFPFLDLQQSLASSEKKNPLLHAIISELLLYLLMDKSVSKSDQHKCLTRMKKTFNETRTDLRELDPQSRRNQVNRDAILYMLKYDLGLMIREYFRVFVMPTERDRQVWTESRSKAVADFVYKEEKTENEAEKVKVDGEEKDVKMEENGTKEKRVIVLPPENAPMNPNHVEVPEFEALSSSDKIIIVQELINRCVNLFSMRDYIEDQIENRKQLQRDNSLANQDTTSKSKELMKNEPQRAKEIAEEVKRMKQERDRKLSALLLHDFQVRVKPIGMDRDYNRYWWLTGGFVGVLLVEARNENNTDDPIVKAQRERRKQLDLPVQETDNTQPVRWSYYDTLEQVDALMKWLDRRGEREANLYKQLDIYYETMNAHMKVLADAGTHEPIPVQSPPRHFKRREKLKIEKKEDVEMKEQVKEEVVTPVRGKSPVKEEVKTEPATTTGRPARRRKRIYRDDPPTESEDDSSTGERRSQRLQIKRKSGDDEPAEEEASPPRKVARVDKPVRTRKPSEKLQEERSTPSPSPTPVKKQTPDSGKKRGRPKREESSDSDSDDEELRNFEASEFLPSEINDNSFKQYINWWAPEVDEFGEDSDDSDEEDEEDESEE
jgi:hypothetical protein